MKLKEFLAILLLFIMIFIGIGAMSVSYGANVDISRDFDNVTIYHAEKSDSSSQAVYGLENNAKLIGRDKVNHTEPVSTMKNTVVESDTGYYYNDTIINREVYNDTIVNRTIYNDIIVNRTIYNDIIVNRTIENIIEINKTIEVPFYKIIVIPEIIIDNPVIPIQNNTNIDQYNETNTIEVQNNNTTNLNNVTNNINKENNIGTYTSDNIKTVTMEKTGNDTVGIVLLIVLFIILIQLYRKEDEK